MRTTLLMCTTRFTLKKINSVYHCLLITRTRYVLFICVEQMVKKTQFFQLMEIEEVEKIDAKFVLKHLDDLKQNEPIRNLIIEVPFFSNHFNNSNSFTILQERFHHERRCDRICQIFCQSQHSISDSGRRI